MAAAPILRHQHLWPLAPGLEPLVLRRDPGQRVAEAGHPAARRRISPPPALPHIMIYWCVKSPRTAGVADDRTRWPCALCCPWNVSPSTGSPALAGVRVAAASARPPGGEMRHRQPVSHLNDLLMREVSEDGWGGRRQDPPIQVGVTRWPLLRRVYGGFDLERMEQSLYVRLNGSHSGRAFLRDPAQDDSRGADNPTGPVRVRRVRGGAAPDPLQAHLPPVRVHPRLLRPVVLISYRVEGTKG